jgi:hypothetical protein
MFYAIDEHLICHTIDLTSKLPHRTLTPVAWPRRRTPGESRAFTYFCNLLNKQ